MICFRAKALLKVKEALGDPSQVLALPKFCLSTPTSRLDPRRDFRFVRCMARVPISDAGCSGGNKAAMLKELQRPDIQELAAGVGTLTFECPQWAFSVSALLPLRCPFTFVCARWHALQTVSCFFFLLERGSVW